MDNFPIYKYEGLYLLQLWLMNQLLVQFFCVQGTIRFRTSKLYNMS